MAILVVDADPAQCRLLESMLHKLGHPTLARASGEAALSLLAGADGGTIDCVVLDLVRPSPDGLGFLSRLRQAAIRVPVIVQIASEGSKNIIAAMRAGAVDFVVKPVSAARLQVSLRNVLTANALAQEIRRIDAVRADALGCAGSIGRSADMADVIPPARPFGPAPAANRDGRFVASLDAAGQIRPLAEVEAELIRLAIGHYRGHMSEAARRLGISRSTLYRKLQALALTAAVARGPAAKKRVPTRVVAAERQRQKIA